MSTAKDRYLARYRCEDIPIDPITIARDKFTIRIAKTTLNEKNWNDTKANPGLDIGDNVKIADKPVINVDNDIVIQGVSLIQFIRSHTHNYKDNGTPMVTAPPNSI